MASHNVDETVDEAGSEDHKRIDTVMLEDHEPVDHEIVAKDGRAVDITKPIVDHETEAEDGGVVDITKPDDDLTLSDVAGVPKDDEPTVLKT
ncbi:UNVERIFIED_CONTAM: hypothetical protein Sangu_2622000 [Sesamum angustifolium]|uniref:Uncharacterized protein n=1 Tax=Sesamum angustifolium TaxID=2727405 RepID=A0AAW2J3M0_9LAMI